MIKAGRSNDQGAPNDHLAMTTNPTTNPRPGRHNLNPVALGAADLDPGSPNDYLLQLRQFVETRALDAIDWYLKHKSPVAFWSKFLRICAISLATFGAILPLIAGTPLLDDGQGAAGKYGYALLALAGASVLFDRLFGLSTRWMRYMTTAMALQRHLAAFEMDWATVWLEVADQTPTAEQRARLIMLLRDFRLVVADELAQETQLWVAEFQSGIAQLERQVQQAHQGKGEVSVAKTRQP